MKGVQWIIEGNRKKKKKKRKKNREREIKRETQREIFPEFRLFEKKS